MTRLKRYVSNPSEHPTPGEWLPHYSLEQIEPGRGRLLAGVQVSEQASSGLLVHQPGDVRFGKLRPYLGKSLLLDDRGCGSGDLLVLRPRAPQELDSRYLHYLTLSKPFVGWATASSYGVKMPRTSWEKLGSFDLELPAIEEQRRVADYLDDEMDRIDRLLAEETTFAELVLERLSASRRVMLLGPDGLGESGWETGKLKRFVTVARGRFTHRPRNDPALYGGPYPFIQTGDIAGAVDGVITSWTQTLNESGLAVSRLAPAGTIVMGIAANIGDVAELGFDSCYPDSVVGLTPGPRVLHGYLIELIRSLRDQLVGGSTLNTQLNTNVDRIGEILIPVPPISTQECLTAELQSMSAEVSAIQGEIARQVSLLGERRQAIVTDAVAGGLGLPMGGY